jgi:hypothetical protein
VLLNCAGVVFQLLDGVTYLCFPFILYASWSLYGLMSLMNEWIYGVRSSLLMGPVAHWFVPWLDALARTFFLMYWGGCFI